MSGPVPLGSNLVVRSPNWLGDAIMTLPAVAWLRQTLPAETSISILSPGNLVPFWKTLPDITNVISLPSNFWIARNVLRSHQFSSAFIFPNSLRTGLEMWMAGIPIRVGYPGHYRKKLLTHTFDKPKQYIPEHQLWHYLRLVSQTLEQELPSTPRVPRLKLQLGEAIAEAIPGSTESGAENVQSRNSTSTQRAFLALCPGAEYGPAKRWPIERFAETANRLAQEYQLDIILLGGPRDEETSAQTARLLSGPVTNLTGKTSLAEFMAWLAQARLVLSNDSGAMHLASLLRTPTVSIFGSTEPRLTGPLTDSVTVLREHVPCSPCFLRECPIDFRCMNSISVDQVLAASGSLLQGDVRSGLLPT